MNTARADETAIRATGLSKRFGHVVAVDGLDLTVRRRASARGTSCTAARKARFSSTVRSSYSENFCVM